MSASAIVLAMHGSPPLDFPREQLGELFGLHMRLSDPSLAGEARARMEGRHAELESRIRNWPRTPQNDPFLVASMELAGHLSEAAGSRVFVGFNEFCSPSMDAALDEAAASGVTRIVVVTPMMTRGGEHSERDIPDAVERARGRHKAVEFVYAWPFDPADVGRFLAGCIAGRLRRD